MPRIAAQDTPARRKLRIIDSVTRRLDELPDDAVARVLTWIDGLVDGDSADDELRTMSAIAKQFDGAEPVVRESVVRWLNENYSAKPETGPQVTTGVDTEPDPYQM